MKLLSLETTHSHHSQDNDLYANNKIISMVINSLKSDNILWRSIKVIKNWREGGWSLQGMMTHTQEPWFCPLDQWFSIILPGHIGVPQKVPKCALGALGCSFTSRPIGGCEPPPGKRVRFVNCQKGVCVPLLILESCQCAVIWKRLKFGEKQNRRNLQSCLLSHQMLYALALHYLTSGRSPVPEIHFQLGLEPMTHNILRLTTSDWTMSLLQLV